MYGDNIRSSFSSGFIGGFAVQFSSSTTSVGDRHPTWTILNFQGSGSATASHYYGRFYHSTKASDGLTSIRSVYIP